MRGGIYCGESEGDMLMRVRLLSESEVETALARLNGRSDPTWRLVEGKLRKRFVFCDFVEAFGFMTRTAIVAEVLNHHPDWSNSYRQVDVALVTHEAGGLTERDFTLAERMDVLARRAEGSR